MTERHETRWNGEPCQARRVTAIVTDDERFPMYWARHLVGTRRKAVEVEYSGETFYLDDEDGSGWNKVTHGGSPHWAHSSLTIGPDSIQDRTATPEPGQQPSIDQYARLQDQLANACELVLNMHQAAVGDTGGGEHSVVQDITDLRTRAERAEAAVERVRALADRWAKAGPPLGTSVSRWVDARLIELNAALDEHEPTDTCRLVEVDGEAIRVRGSGKFTDQAQEFAAEIVRAAKRKHEAEHGTSADRLTVDTITGNQLDALYAERDRLTRLAEDRAERIDTANDCRKQLRARVAQQEAETMRQHERAGQAEAALVRVHHVAALIHAGAPWTANHHETAARIRAAIRPPADEPRAEQAAPVDACAQHPAAPVIGGICGGCAQYPSDTTKEH